MPLRSDIVAEARRWVGTPYHHLGRVMGHGVDCYGVIEMVGRALGIPVPDGLTYSRLPDEKELLRNMDLYAVNIPVAEAQPGDIILLPYDKKIRHMAILTDKGMIHAYEPVGKVVEHSIDRAWKGLIRRAYQYPGVA
jgi:NlpC/P60 family putative phage cell wall peptidase